MIIRGRTYEFDDSVYNTPGAVYDLGCYRWEWLEPFVDRKQVIGVDPNEHVCPYGAQLVCKAVLPYGGSVVMQGKGLQAGCFDSATDYKIPHGYGTGRPELLPGIPYTVPAVTWAELIAQHGPAAFVKINIEGAEIPLLMTAKQPMAPQLCIAFHQPGLDYSQPNWPQAEAIDACIKYLRNWYKIEMTELDHSRPDKWYRMMLR